jgi:hypothetical protein
MRLFTAALLFWICSPAAWAVDAIVLEAREITVAGQRVEGAAIRLDLLSPEKTRVTVSASGTDLPAPLGRLSAMTLVCDAPVIAEPRFACDDGRLSARGGPTGAIDMKLRGSMDTVTGLSTFAGEGLKLAGTSLRFDGRADQKGWRVRGKSGTTSIAQVREFAKPWFELPKDITGDGKVRLEGSAGDSGKGLAFQAQIHVDEVDLTNEASTIVTDKLSATARLESWNEARRSGYAIAVQGRQGQVLVGPVLLDFAKNPLQLTSQLLPQDGRIEIVRLSMQQQALLELSGSGQVDLTGAPRVSADLKIHRLEFPAAYTSYMQITVAATLLGDLRSSGSLRGEVAVRDNALTALHVVPDSLELHDNKNRLNLSKVSGDIHWGPANATAVPRSTLSWASGGAYGLSGGAAEIQFHAQGESFAITRPTKLPVLDGAIAIDTFAVGNLGASNMEIAFKGAVEPISMTRLAKVFGWPEFQGTLAASIPGVTLKDNVLAFQGNVESQVFGGRIVGSNIRLQDPLGKWPQFFADVRARDLDLDLVTRTFDVGSITGRLEVDVLGLELFAWSPVRFDARLATPKGDKSRHRISAKAVTSLSNVGGGGGGVVQALQGGVLRFFDEYSYEKLGITCRLRNDVCEMSGIEPAGIGYYIVKGAGLPRIDIVGNAGRVRWSQLLESIATTNFGGATTE